MAETPSPNFIIEHLLPGLYGVDAPVHFSAPLPKPHNWFQAGGGFATEGGIMEESCRRGRQGRN